MTAALHDGARVRRRPVDARRPAARRAARAVDRGRARRGGRCTAPTSPASPSASGPGPFTGLRAGVVTARVLGFALGVAGARGVLARRAGAAGRRARRRATGRLRRGDRRPPPRGLLGGVRRTAASRAGPSGPPATAARRRARRPGGRSGAAPRCAPTCRAAAAGRRTARTSTLAAVAELAAAPAAAALLAPEPLYLRRPDAAPPGARKRVLRDGADGVRCGRCAGGTSSAVQALDAELFGPTSWSPETFWSELAAGPTPLVRGRRRTSGGELAGYAGLLAGGDEADVQTIAVAPAPQRRGLGTRLLARADRRGGRARGATSAARGARRQRAAPRCTRRRLRAARAAPAATTSPGDIDAWVMRRRPLPTHRSAAHA